MAKLDLTQVEGFKELNQKVKKLSDSVKRKEILAIQKKLAAPVRKAYQRNLPEATGNLGRSVAVRTISARKSGGNPAIVVRPSKRGKNDGYYKFMVIRKGTKTGSTARGSRKGLNTVVTSARNKTLSQQEAGLLVVSEKTMQKFMQKKIDKLSV